MLHHDNATPHTATITLALIGSSGVNMIAQQPYSPDLVPSDYFLFPHLKSHLRGRQFPTVRAMEEEVHRILHAIPSDLFHKAIGQLPLRWHKCILANGDYFKGQNLAPRAELVVGSDQSEEED